MFETVKKYLALIGAGLLALGGVLLTVFFRRRDNSGTDQSVVSGKDSGGINGKIALVRDDLQQAESALQRGTDRCGEYDKRAEERDRERDGLNSEVADGFRNFNDDASGEDDSD